MKKWGKGTVKRMLGSGAGLIFKGSGFYQTDYVKNNKSETKTEKNEKPTEKQPDLPDGPGLAGLPGAVVSHSGTPRR